MHQRPRLWHYSWDTFHYQNGFTYAAFLHHHHHQSFQRTHRPATSPSISTTIASVEWMITILVSLCYQQSNGLECVSHFVHRPWLQIIQFWMLDCQWPHWKGTDGRIPTWSMISTRLYASLIKKERIPWSGQDNQTYVQHNIPTPSTDWLGFRYNPSFAWNISLPGIQWENASW